MFWAILALLVAFMGAPLAQKKAFGLLGGLLYAGAFVGVLYELFVLKEASRFELSTQPFAFVDFTFVLDFMSLSFASLVLLIGTLVSVYSVFYMKGPDRPWFLSLIHFFTLAMLGIIFSNNLLAIFIFWELTTLCSYFLICFKSEKEESRRAAQTSLIITALGGLSLLCGFLILGFIGGSYDLSLIKIPLGDSYFGIAILLIFLGVFTKSAQFPFHFWLPQAAPAPTPATAYLHSATMVQAGVFLLFRLSPLISIHHYWSKVLIPVGLASAILMSLFIFFEKDLKKIFAYTTISALGLTFFLMGKGTPEAFGVAFVWVLAHALYKAPLFLFVGNIENSSKTRDLQRLSNQVLSLRGTLLVALMGFVSLWALPPSLSFAAKNFILRIKDFSTFELLAVLLVLSASSSVGFTILDVLFKKKNFASKESFLKNEKDPSSLWLSVFVGLMPGLFLGFYSQAFSSFVSEGLGSVLHLDLSSIRLSETRFFKEIYSLAGILFVAFLFSRVALRLRRLRLPSLSFQQTWDFCFEFFLKSAKTIFGFFLNSRIELYLFTTFAFLFFLISQISGLELALPLLTVKNPSVTPFELGLIVTMLISCVVAVRADSTFYAIISLGIIGIGTAYVYLANAAPDLALVQILVESLFLIILVSTLKDMPKTLKSLSSRYFKGIFLFTSLCIGIFVGIFTFLASIGLRPKTLMRYFAENSYDLAHAKNIVNAIVVDFRGLDTLGEITVFLISVLAIINFLRNEKKSENHS